MIHFGLKIWSSNDASLFIQACGLFERGYIHCIELYHDPRAMLDYGKLSIFTGVPVSIHNMHSDGWHEFVLGNEELALWKETLKLADFFCSTAIVVHPGRSRDFVHFKDSLLRIDDPRIMVENMAGLDICGKDVYARTLQELRDIRTLRPICFDIEKAVKSACFQSIEYKDFIIQCLLELQPHYFHVSGGDKNSPVDEHLNLWEANFDIEWIREMLADYARNREITLIFETPKNADNLDNDIKNIDFFKAR